MSFTCSKTLFVFSCAFALTLATINSTLPTVPPVSAIDKADNISTGNPSKCPASTKYYPQPVDHATFNGDYNDTSSIFHQQYEINDTYYKPGGPILFFQGAESPKITCVEPENAFLEWAKELNALAVSIEHRYFGLSCPYGLNYSEYSTWNTTVLQPLTLDNILRDSISLLRWIKEEAYPSAKDAKVVVESGSYGGTLASLLRLNYPDEIYASIATSPCLKGLVSDPTHHLTYGIGDWTNMVFNDYSTEAAAVIKQGMSTLRARLANGSYSGLQEQLHLCSEPKTSSDGDELLYAILRSYSLNAQENYATSSYPFYQTINATLASNDSLSAVGAAMEIYNKAVGDTECLNWDPLYSAGGPFLWLRCTQIPFPNPYSTAETIFGPVQPDLTKAHILDPWCQASFGIDSIDGGEAWQRELAVDQHTLETSERLLIVDGLTDPITAFGANSWNPGSSRNHSRIMYVGQSAHTEVQRPPVATDSEALVQARLYIFNSVKQWLDM